MKTLRFVVLAVCLVLTSSGAALARPFVYVTNTVPGSVSAYEIGAGGLLSPLTPATVPAGLGAIGVAASPDGRSLYVANFGGEASTISQYDINPLTGGLSPKAPATVAASGVWQLAVSPDGRSVYVTDITDSRVLQFTVNQATGTLSVKTPPSVGAGPAGGIPFGVAVAPNGKSAYVTTFSSGVFQYDIDPVTGNLSPKQPSTVPADTTPEGIGVSPNGTSAYVTNINSDTISQYDIDPTSGALSPKSPPTVPTGSAPTNGVAITPDNKSAYVYNSGGRQPASVSQYDINPLGALFPKTPATVPAGQGSTASQLAVSPDGENLYVVNSSVVRQYTIDPASGTLTPKNPATAPTPGSSVGVAVASPRSLLPTLKEQCKNGGWRTFGVFKNQGDCVSFVATKGKKPPVHP
jgi:DNA-binding beta-propeller fold protein YncE